MEKHSEESGEHLLGHRDEYSDDELKGSKGRQPRSASSWLRTNFPLVLILLVLLYIAVLQTIELSWKSTRCPSSKSWGTSDDHHYGT